MSKTFNMVGGGGGKAVLAVAVTNGTATSVTATKSGVSVSLTYGGGIWNAVLPSLGTWTVTATDGTHLQTDTVNASIAGLYSLTLKLQDVPIGYTQLEYVVPHEFIEGVDTSIYLPYYPVTDNNFYGTFRRTSYSTYTTLFVSAMNNAVGIRISLQFTKSTNHTGPLWINGNASANWYYFDSLADTAKHTFRSNQRAMTIDGITGSSYGGSAVTSNTDVGLRIGAGDGKTEIYVIGMTKTDGVTTEFELIPAKRNTDDAVGLYDIINNVFYQGALWTAGPAV